MNRAYDKRTQGFWSRHWLWAEPRHYGDPSHFIAKDRNFEVLFAGCLGATSYLDDTGTSGVSMYRKWSYY